jgi:sugar/nucleoside kinase (ribokinase family)
MNSAPEVLCAGIVVADHLCAPIARLPRAGELVMTDKMVLTIGGCAANAAVDLVKMGVRSAVVGRVGDDVFGRIVMEMLKDNGVDASLLGISAGRDTSQTLIVNVQNEDRRFIHTFGANSDFRAGDIPVPLPASCRVLYLGGYLLMPTLRQEELMPVFQSARAQGVTTVLDVAIPHAAPDYLQRLDRLLPLVDVFLPNHHEAEVITGEKDPCRQAEIFHKLGAGTVVITLGGEGAVLLCDECRLRAGVFRVPFVDASGGGDAFDAGFMHGLLHSQSPRECLRIASALGASCVRAVGTTLGVFTAAECADFLARNSLDISEW